MAIITLEADILYSMADSAGVVGQQTFKETKNFELVGDWVFKDKLNDIKTIEFAIENNEENRANVLLERNVNIPLITPLNGIIVKKTPNDAVLNFKAAELAWHFKRRKFKCHETPRVVYTDEDWHDRLWKKRKKIKIPKEKIDLKSGTLVNYVFLYSVTDEELKFHALPNGNDIFFAQVDTDGISTKLDHEIESYANSTGTLVAHIRIPKMESQNENLIYIYYDNDDATNQENITGVWSTEHKAIYHLHEDSLDSTSNNNDGTDTSIVRVAGKIADAAQFDNIDSKIDCGSDSSLDDLFGNPGGGRISSWFDANSDGEANVGRILNKVQWNLQILNEASGLVRIRFEQDWDAGATTSQWETVVDIPINTKIKVEVFYDSSSPSNDPTIYVNGLPRTIANGLLTETTAPGTTADSDAGSNLIIGNLTGQTATFDGEIDETRLEIIPTFDSDVTLDDLVRIEYRNQNKPSSFYEIGNQENFKEQADIIAQSVIDSANKDMPILDKTTISGLVGLWKVNGDVLDSKGSNDGTWIGTEQYVDGKYLDDRAAKFNGSSRITTTDVPFDYDITDKFSFAFIFKALDASSQEMLIAKGTGIDASVGYYISYEDSGAISFQIFTTSAFEITSTKLVNDNKFHIIKVSYAGLSNRSGMKIYIDGVLDTTGTVSAITGSMLNNELLTFGAESDGGLPFTGILDDIRNYNIEFTKKQVIKLFLATESGIDDIVQTMKWRLGEGNTVEIDGLISLWKLNSDVIDSKGNNNGTVSGTEVYVDGKYGKALQFNALDTIVNCGSDSSLDDLFVGGGTISDWFNPKSDGEGNEGRLCQKKNGVNTGWELYVAAESTSKVKIVFRHDFSTTHGQWETAVDIPINEITKISVMYDNSAVGNDPIIYINSIVRTVPLGTLTETSTPVGTADTDVLQDFVIGNEIGQTKTFHGFQDDIRAYSRIITSAEELALFNATSSGIDRVRDDDIPTDLIGLSFQHQTHLQSLQSIALAVPTDLWFENASFAVRMEPKGKTINEVVDVTITSKPSFDLAKVANFVNVLGKRTEIGKQLEKTVSDNTGLRYNYEQTIVDTNINTQDQLKQISNTILAQVKDLTPDLKATLPYDQFNKFDLQSGDRILINDKDNDVNGFFRIIKLVAKSSLIILNLDNAINSRIRTKSASLSDLVNSILRTLDETQIES